MKFNIRKSSLPNNCVVDVSTQLNDPRWDAFLQKTPTGNHLQSSLWARLKAMNNWKPVRVTLSKDGQILAGTQFLAKSIPMVGQIGYLQQGPIIGDETITYPQIKKMIDIAMAKTGTLITFIHPHHSRQDFARYLEDIGLVSCDLSAFPTATVLIDLHQDLDTIFSGMKHRTRNGIRSAARKGVITRELSCEEIPIFYQLYKQSAERNDFQPLCQTYFEKMYDLFCADHMKLIYTEHEGVKLSSLLLIAYGDTVAAKRCGWSGGNSKLHPNEALHWHAIKWAKEQGYHYYDFEGINENVARATLAGEKLPPDSLNHYSRFKVGFGGEALILPRTYLYSRNFLVNWIGQQSFIHEMGQSVIAYTHHRQASYQSLNRSSE